MTSGRWPWAAAAALLGLLFAAPTTAQTPAARAESACRQACSAEPGATASQVQACHMRCAAGRSHAAQQNATGVPERGRATGSAASGGAGSAAARPVARTLVAYAAPAPGRGFALSEALTDRMAAHRTAEQACFARNGNAACRALGETSERCAAVAVAVRAQGTVVTADPRTFIALFYAFGTGTEQRRAEQAALSACAARRAPDGSCRVAIARCGP